MQYFCVRCVWSRTKSGLLDAIFRGGAMLLFQRQKQYRHNTQTSHHLLRSRRNPISKKQSTDRDSQLLYRQEDDIMMMLHLAVMCLMLVMGFTFFCRHAGWN